MREREGLKTLEKLVTSQREEYSRGQTKAIRSTYPPEILDQFTRSPAFTRLYHQARVLSNLPDKIGPDSLGKNFHGALYQNLAYLILLSGVGGRSTLLSSARVLALFEKLYPYAERVPQPFGLTALDGISVPDMLLVKGNTVATTYEATIHLAFGYFSKKARSQEGLRCRFPQLFGGSSLSLVVSNGPDGLRHPQGLATPLGITIHGLPLSQNDIRDYFRYIEEEYTSRKGEATLRQIQLSHRTTAPPTSFSPAVI